MLVSGSDKTFNGDVAVVANPAGPVNETDRPRNVGLGTVGFRLDVSVAWRVSGEDISKIIELVSEACGGDEDPEFVVAESWKELENELRCWVKARRTLLWLAGPVTINDPRRLCSKMAARAPSVEMVVVVRDVEVMGV